jgi:DNA primase
MRLHLATGIWFCFACSPIASDGTPQGADVIDWVRRTEGVSVSEAIRLLHSGAAFTNAWAGHADRYRPTASAIEWEAPVLERTRPERVAEALRAAWAYYTSPSLQLRGGEYLAARGINVGILEEHTGRPGVGHTGPERDGLVRALQACGFTDDELIDAGLASRRRNESTLTDFYRQRVLIPLTPAISRMRFHSSQSFRGSIGFPTGLAKIHPVPLCKPRLGGGTRQSVPTARRSAACVDR